MKTLKQILELETMMPFEEYKLLEESIIKAAKKWLQQKQKEYTTNATDQFEEIASGIFLGLLEELEQ